MIREGSIINKQTINNYSCNKGGEGNIQGYVIRKNKRVMIEDVSEKLIFELRVCRKLCWGHRERGLCRRKYIPGRGISMCKGLKRETNSVALLVNEGQCGWSQLGLAFSRAGLLNLPPSWNKAWVKVKVH